MILRLLAIVAVCHALVFFGATAILGYDPERAFLLNWLLQ